MRKQDIHSIQALALRKWWKLNAAFSPGFDASRVPEAVQNVVSKINQGL